MALKNKSKKAKVGKKGKKVATVVKKIPTQLAQTVIPQECFAIHKFTNIHTIVQGTAGQPQVFTYRINHLYDPNYNDTTGINNQQPIYYDQLAALYNNYVVYKVDVILTGVLTTNGYFGMRAHQTIAIPTNFILECERDASIKLYTSGQKVVIKRSFDIADIYGKTRAQLMAEDSFIGHNSATLPLDPAYMHCYFMNTDVSGLTTASYKIDFKFHVKWLRRVEIGES